MPWTHYLSVSEMVRAQKGVIQWSPSPVPQLTRWQPTREGAEHSFDPLEGANNIIRSWQSAGVNRLKRPPGLGGQGKYNNHILLLLPVVRCIAVPYQKSSILKQAQDQLNSFLDIHCALQAKMRSMAPSVHTMRPSLSSKTSTQSQLR